MKANFKYVMLMATALVLGLSSCSNDDDAIVNSPEEGVKTYASIEFTSPTTYADHAGTEKESMINSVDVFIYSASGFLQNHQKFENFAETAPNSGVWKADEKMETTTGAKQVYLGINLPAAIRTSLSVTNKTVAALITVAHDVTVAQIATDDNFVMGSNVATPTFAVLNDDGTLPSSNTVKVNVKRFASKFTVEEKAGLDLTGVDGGNLSDLYFDLGQVNESTYAAQSEGTVKDPNYTAPTTPGLGLSGKPADNSKYIKVNGSGVIDINTLRAKYAPENTNDNIIKGNLTYVSVSAKFLPEEMIEGSTGNWESKPNTGTPATFYCIRTTTGNVYFKTEETAKDYATEYGIATGKILTYTGGICYYTVFVNKAKNYDVFRNDFYRVTIAEIVGLGEVEPGPVDPKEPVEVDSKIDVEVTVAPWNLLSEDINLIPQ